MLSVMHVPISFRSLFFCASLCATAAAQSFKLNGPLEREPSGRFPFVFQTSPDGRYVVYPADKGDLPSGLYGLYSVAASDKPAPVLLGQTFSPGRFQITPLGKDVILVDPLGLVIVPIDGSSSPRSLSGPLASNRTVSWFEASRDDVHVLYTADQLTNDVVELFSAAVTGEPPVKLSGALVPGGDVRTAALSSDGTLALYSADQDADEVVELYVVSVDGSAPVSKLPIPLVTGGDVVSFQLGLDGASAIYTADQEEDERFELFTIPLDGSRAPLKLSGALVAGGDVGSSLSFGLISSAFVQAYDGSRILYRADQETDGHFELYSVPADGSGAAAKLSSATDLVRSFTQSYDSSWVIYQSSGSFGYELFSVPIDGSAPSRRIALTTYGSTFDHAQVSFDSQYVVYATAQETYFVRELYSVPIDGSALPTKLNSPLPPGGDVVGFGQRPSFAVMQDGVAFRADQEQDQLFELHLAPIAGGAVPRKLAAGQVEAFAPSAPTLALPPTDLGVVLFLHDVELSSVAVEAGAQPVTLDALPRDRVVESVYSFLLSASGERVVYRSFEAGDEAATLHSVRPAERREHVRLQAGLPSGGFVRARFFTADERRVLYTAPGNPSVTGLYSEPVDGSGPPVNLGRPPVPAVLLDDVPWLLPDGQRVAFLAGYPEFGLFIAPADGSSPAFLLSADLNVLQGLQFSADGSRIAFRASSSELGLFVVPSDGSAPPRRVDTGESPEYDFALAQDGKLVVFRGGAIGVHDLFVAPSDGSAAPRNLNVPLQDRAEIRGFALAPDSTRAVYLGDQTVDETFELYTVPLDGSAPPVRLHPALATRRNVQDFRISSDSRYVVYRADPDTNEQHQLYSVPIDASGPPVRLNGSLVTGGDVREYEISPDGTRVVYLADQRSNEVAELFSTPIHGARRPARLSRRLVSGGEVGSFQISADSSTVVFTAQRNSMGALTLLAAPIGGQEKASELAGPFQGGGSVLDQRFRISADGTLVAYLADQDEEGAIELFAARRAPAPAVRAAK